MDTLPMLAIPKILKNKDQIEIIQNKRDYSLEIKDKSYFREQKEIECEGPEMY